MLNVRYEQPNCDNATTMREAFDAQGMLYYHNYYCFIVAATRRPRVGVFFPYPTK